MTFALVVSLLLGAGDSPGLPEGHPPLSPAPGAATSPELPAGHPPLGPGQEAAAPVLPKGHPPVGSSAGSGKAATSADELLKKLDAQPDLRSKPKTLEVALSMGKLYYANGRYADAAPLLGQAVEKGEPLRVQVSKLQRQGVTPALCPPPAPPSFEAAATQAQTFVQAGNKGAGLGCALVALQPWVEAQRLWAYSQLLLRQPAQALEALNKLLEAVNDAEARYARAALVLETQGDDKKALERAKADLELVARETPASRRTAQAQALLGRVQELLAAGGVSAYGQKQRVAAANARSPAPTAPPFAGAQAGAAGPPPLTKEMIDAVQNTERTPELEQGLAKLVEEAEQKLAQEQFQDALDAYKRVVPFQPENGRARAGMAWALVGLNRQPMADRVWSVAVSNDAAAVDRLGDTLKSKGNVKGAKAVWAKLAQSAPDYAQKAGLTSKLQ